MSLKNNPHYENGVFKGTQIINNIENTTYGSIEVALESKKALVEDFKEHFGWNESNKEVAETLGMIAALEKEQSIIIANTPVYQVGSEDVTNVAMDLGIDVSEEQSEEILKRYPTAQEEDPGATWNLVIEHLIYEANN